jgi:hypothetical protein
MSYILAYIQHSVDISFKRFGKDSFRAQNGSISSKFFSEHTLLLSTSYLMFVLWSLHVEWDSVFAISIHQS